MLIKKEWKEFKDSGLLWWINRSLHLFGWAIVIQLDIDGNITNVFPARTKFRGFEEKQEQEGFQKLTKFMDENSKELMNDVNG